jgi:hypothetical protein
MMNQELEKKYRLSKLLALAFILSVFVYGAVLFIVLRAGRGFLGRADLPPLSGLMIYLAGLCLVPLVGIRWLKPFILRQNSAGPIASRLLIADLTAYALCEMPSLMGFVAAMVYQQMPAFVIPAAVSLIGYGLYFPKVHQWEAAASR